MICIADVGNDNMKPVTEDQVRSLLDGLEKREKEALRALAADAETLPMSGGRMTAKVLRFGSTSGRGAPEAETGGFDVVPLYPLRAKARRRRTSKGVFYYVAGAGAPKPSA